MAARWGVVLGAFLVMLVGFGAIYSYAAFAEAIAAEFQAERASVALIYALSGGACYLVSAVAGPLADRIGPRVPAALGMLLVGVGLLVAATAGSMMEVYAGYGLLIGLGAGFAYVPAVAAVQRRFRAQRGLASGIAVSGIGVGTALVPPGAEALLAAGEWRPAFVLCGLLAMAIGLAGAALLGPAAQPGARSEKAGWARVLGGRGFAQAYGGVLLVSVPAILPHALLVATARDMGLGAPAALALLGLIGLGTIAGRFLLAALADVLGRRATFLACCAGMAGSLLLWAAAGDAPLLQGFALLFGALQGGMVALLPAFIADSFGPRALGGVLGVLYTSRGIALLLAPPAFAVAVAAAGHAVPIAAAACIGLAGAWLLARLRQPATGG
jgi:MFS family permease